MTDFYNIWYVGWMRLLTGSRGETMYNCLSNRFGTLGVTHKRRTRTGTRRTHRKIHEDWRTLGQLWNKDTEIGQFQNSAQVVKSALPKAGKEFVNWARNSVSQITIAKTDGITGVNDYTPAIWLDRLKHGQYVQNWKWRRYTNEIWPFFQNSEMIAGKYNFWCPLQNTFRKTKHLYWTLH